MWGWTSVVADLIGCIAPGASFSGLLLCDILWSLVAQGEASAAKACGQLHISPFILVPIFHPNFLFAMSCLNLDMFLKPALRVGLAFKGLQDYVWYQQALPDRKDQIEHPGSTYL